MGGARAGPQVAESRRSLEGAGGCGLETDAPVEIGGAVRQAAGETLGMPREAGQLAAASCRRRRPARPRDAGRRPRARGGPDSSGLAGWLLVAGCRVAGIVVGLLAVARPDA